MQLGTMVASVNATQLQVSVAEQANELTKETSHASLEQADDALSSSKEAFRSQQRPYIMAEPFPQFKTSEQREASLFQQRQDRSLVPWIGISVKNVGISPSIEVHTSFPQIIAGEPGTFKKLIETYEPKWKVGSAGTIIVQNDSMVVGDPRRDLRTLSSEEARSFQEGTFLVAIVGDVSYRDEYLPRLKTPYLTRYCFMINPTGLAISSCTLPGSSFMK